MPELPEVETVRRTLEAALRGAGVERTVLRRRAVWRGPACPLRGGRVAAVKRHGKQLALVGEAGGVVCVHLGMSGQLRLHGPPVGNGTPGGKPTMATATRRRVALPVHTHVRWRLDDGRVLGFTDPRRFGGVWAFADESDLHAQRWSRLGPDATVISTEALHTALRRTKRALKAALLDQAVVAGLGNIYVDELLFEARVSPVAVANRLSRARAGRLVGAMRGVLGRAIAAGGTTLRDYVDANGQEGGFLTEHQAYGRGGEPCARCGWALRKGLVAGRTTVWCGRCQRVEAGASRSASEEEVR